MNSITVVFSAYGHENIMATHRTTFEMTKEKALTRQGDCIIAVKATIAAVDLPIKFKQAARKKGSRITITIEANELKEVTEAKGSPQLTFTHPTDLVVRKSSHVCGRTLAIWADKAANDLSRKIVEKIKDPNQKITISLTVEDY
jgi:hypothetical protein